MKGQNRIFRKGTRKGSKGEEKRKEEKRRKKKGKGIEEEDIVRKTKRSAYKRPLSILARGLSELSLSSLNSFMRS